MPLDGRFFAVFDREDELPPFLPGDKNPSFLQDITSTLLLEKRLIIAGKMIAKPRAENANLDARGKQFAIPPFKNVEVVIRPFEGMRDRSGRDTRLYQLRSVAKNDLFGRARRIVG